MSGAERTIVIGNVAQWLGKKATEQYTHRWTLYVRNVDGSSLEPYIQKVVFILHPSFQNSYRELEKPPFEVVEHGWGEFDAQIEIHTRGSTQVLQHTHSLKLFPVDTEYQLTKKPVTSERKLKIVVPISLLDPPPLRASPSPRLSVSHIGLSPNEGSVARLTSPKSSVRSLPNSTKEPRGASAEADDTADPEMKEIKDARKRARHQIDILLKTLSRVDDEAARLSAQVSSITRENLPSALES